MSVLVALIRSPRAGAARALREGSLGQAAVLVAVATAISIAHTARLASDMPVDELVFGPRRSPMIDALLAAFGTQLTAIVVYVVQTVWTSVLIATAVSPLIVWLLGATAVHASARLYGLPGSLRPMVVLFGYATALTRPLADAPGAVFGVDRVAAPIGEIAGLIAIGWLGAIVWNGIRSNYGVAERRATAILVAGIVLFYVVPIALVVVAVVAILVAAVALGYVPAR
jgi:Yip1-like protein